MQICILLTKLNNRLTKSHCISFFEISTIVLMCQVNYNKFAITNMFQQFRSNKVVVLNLINKYCVIPSFFYTFSNCFSKILCIISKFHCYENVTAVRSAFLQPINS